MALTAAWADPVTGIGADGFESFTKLAAADANEYILQNIMYLKTPTKTFVADWDGTVGNTSSTLFTNIPGASAPITVPDGGGRLKITCFIQYTPTGNDPYFTVALDGTNLCDATVGIHPAGAPNQYTNLIGAVVLTAAQTAGAHTVTLQHKINTSTVTVVGFSLLVEDA